MKLITPYKCDYCPNIKGESNHWWLQESSFENFVLVRWNDELAAKPQYVEHICSQACAAKALSKWLSMAARPVVEASEDTKDEWFTVCVNGHEYSLESEVPKTCLTCGESQALAINMKRGIRRGFLCLVRPGGNPAIMSAFLGEETLGKWESEQFQDALNGLRRR